MTKTYKESGPELQPLAKVPALCEAVAHELNNIGASLFGFVELAAERTSADPFQANLIGELRIGVSRIAGLAALLEGLAETGTRRASVAIAACVSRHPEAGRDELNVLWRCERSIRVFADAGHVWRSVQLLVSLTLPPIGEGSDVSVDLRTASLSDRCSSCGETLPARAVGISAVTARSAASHQKPRRQRSETSIRRLSLAACSHIAHLAGAHLLMANPSLPPILIVPLADA